MTGSFRLKLFPSCHQLLELSLSQQNSFCLSSQYPHYFSINGALNLNEAVEQQRWIGCIFNINSLYNIHFGTLKPFTLLREVRKAICNIIYQDLINNNLDLTYLDCDNPSIWITTRKRL